MPPGNIALFPSAIIAHENIPITDHEERRVITAFSSGNFFQFAEANFKMQKDLKDPTTWKTSGRTWRYGIRRFPKMYGAV
jgi:hypothetical protein